MQVFIAAALRAASASLLILFGLSSATAAADPDVIGKRYWEAQSEFGQANLTPVVATTVGDRLTQDQCWVIGVSKAPNVSGSGSNNLVRVNLSCYDKPASGKSTGFSAGNHGADAEAVRTSAHQEELKWKASEDGQKWCAQATVEHPEWGVIEGC